MIIYYLTLVYYYEQNIFSSMKWNVFISAFTLKLKKLLFYMESYTGHGYNNYCIVSHKTIIAQLR